MKDWTEKKLNLTNELKIKIKIKTQDCYKRTPKSMDWSRVLAFHQWFLKKQNSGKRNMKTTKAQDVPVL